MIKWQVAKDGTELYNPFGIKLSQCLSHILRYLKSYYTDIKHTFPKKMNNFLNRCNSIRNSLINKEINSFTNFEYTKLIEEYDSILDGWEKELREDTENHLFDEEYYLFRRMKYDNKKKWMKHIVVIEKRFHIS